MSDTVIYKTLRKPERLCSRKQMQSVIQQKLQLFAHPLKLMYATTTPGPNTAPAQVAFVVPKRYFKKAHQRNYIKRLMREAYRNYKPAFYKQLHESKKNYHLLFVYTVVDSPNFNDIKKN
jgi:ribonuclease P protein component